MATGVHIAESVSQTSRERAQCPYIVPGISPILSLWFKFFLLNVICVFVFDTTALMCFGPFLAIQLLPGL